MEDKNNKQTKNTPQKWHAADNYVTVHWVNLLNFLLQFLFFIYKYDKFVLVNNYAPFYFSFFNNSYKQLEKLAI